MSQIPLLILSDAPTSVSGLGRICRDLAVRIATQLPEFFRVATIGYGGPYSSKLPFHQYDVDMDDWNVFNLPDVWEDFAGIDHGAIFTIWDSSRMLWFARPENCKNDKLRKFLTTARFQSWGYFPMDATGPNDRLTSVLGHTIEGYDRVLAYSKWAEDILRRTLTDRPILDNLTNLPHGIDTDIFQPRHRVMARRGFGEKMGIKTEKGRWLSIPDDAYVIGIVGTNQARKDYGLGLQVVQRIAREKKVFVWIHTDVPGRTWGIPALLNDLGILTSSIITSLPFSDEVMSWCYSACDVTLGIGLGEGFGYPIFESLACGTPCIHGNYGGAAEHLPEEFKVEPLAYRMEGPYSCIRPVFDPKDWVDKILALPKKNCQSLLPEYLSWNMNWRKWKEWFLKGHAECQPPVMDKKTEGILIEGFKKFREMK